MSVLIAVLVTLSMAGVDFCHARYTYALINRRGYRAAVWSVGQWACASVGFVVAVKLSIYYLGFEAIGLAAGTILGARRLKRYDQNLPRRNQDQMPCVPKNGCSGSCDAL